MAILRVKVCCIRDVDEARLAVELGASALGLVSAMPSGPGAIPEEVISTIARQVPPGIGSFLLTSRQDVESIIDQQRRCRVNTIQLCDRLETGSLSDLRNALPGVALVQVVHVTGPESVDEACQAAADGADAILLDSGDQRLAIKELGGTGRRHDWSLSRRIRDSIDKPLFLAGGLRVENVREAIETVQPFGLDVCSGVQMAGRLDASLLKNFLQLASEQSS